MNTEYGKCEICGKQKDLERTYFYYNIPCECCGCKIDGKDMHFVLVRHCDKCTPDLPSEITPTIKSKIDNEPYMTKIVMFPDEIRGRFLIEKGFYFDDGIIKSK